MSQPTAQQSTAQHSQASSPWRVAGASVRGASHARTGQPCQDAQQWQRWAGDGLIAAVADGAGSALLGEVGATVAAAAAVMSLGSRLAVPDAADADAIWENLLRDALQAALTAVEAAAVANHTDVRELATTLIVVAARPGIVAAAQVGDGAVVAGDHGGKISGITVPQSGEYINETTFLITPTALATAQIKVWREEVTHLAMFSDGLQMLALKLPDGTPHAPFFTPLFGFIDATAETEAQAELVAFLQGPRVQERTDDDLTLLLAGLSTPRRSS